MQQPILSFCIREMILKCVRNYCIQISYEKFGHFVIDQFKMYNVKCFMTHKVGLIINILEP